MSETTSTDQTIRVTIERVVDGGSGLARLQTGEIVLVEGVLQGESVDLDLSKLLRRKGVARAGTDAVLTITDVSDGRVTPACEYIAAGCGGCDAMYASTDEQHRAKRTIVVESLSRIAKLGADEAEQIVSSVVSTVDADSYRTTLRLHRDHDGRAGFHQQASNDVVPVGSCLVGDRAFDDIIVGLNKLHPSIADVTIRTSADTGQSLVVLTSNWRANDPHEVAKLCSFFPAKTNIVLSGSRTTRTLQGQPFISERVGTRRFRVSGPSFFQSGPQAAKLLADAVVAAVADGLRLAAISTTKSIHVADLYAGVGLLGAALVDDPSLRVGELSVVEQSRSSVGDARFNLADLDAGVSIYEGDVGDFGRDDFESPVDVVVADPARVGLGTRGVEAIVSIDPSVVVLVGCEPAAFARDVAGLCEHGFSLASVQVLDLFAQTWHVESVALLVRQHRGQVFR
jgi:tRNA/tmRNA/rRNA uracil-C5-methylase (TrmA/RlmC/RlmD family)